MRIVNSSIISVFFILTSSTIIAQETKTLMGPDTDISFVSSAYLKTSSIKEYVVIGYEMSGGALFNQSILLGVAGGFNITHPTIHFGYLGLLGQYTYKPENIINFSGQLLLGTGSAKGNMQVKSSAFDNLLNITGDGFYFIEPGINVEFNLTGETRLLVGMSYRYVTGFDEVSFEQHDYEKNTTKQYAFSDTDLSTLYFNIGVKIGKY